MGNVPPEPPTCMTSSTTAKAFADIAKRNRKRVDDIGEHETRDPARQHKLQRVVALNAKEQDVARAHERCLQQGQTAKEQVAAQVDLVQAHGGLTH